METLFEIIERDPDADALVKIKKHLDGSTLNLCSKHTRRTTSYSYGQAPTKTSDTVAMVPAHYAMSKGKWLCARFLIERDVHALTIFPDDFNTPLHEVARCENDDFLNWFWNCQEIFDKLRSLPIEKVNQRNEDKFTPLMVAVRTHKILERITIWGNFPNDFAAVDDKGRSLVHIAIESKHTALVGVLLAQHHALATMKTLLGTFPVHLASMTNNKIAIIALAQCGANLHEHDDDFNTPLHWAAKFGHVDMMQFLLENDANANAINWEKDAPIHCVVKCHEMYSSSNEEKKFQRVLSLLLSFGADFYIKNNKSKDAWDLATECFPNDKPKRKEFHQAMDEHVKANPSDRTVSAVVCYLKNRSAKTFNDTTHCAFVGCLDQIAPQPSSVVFQTRFWSSANTSCQNVQQPNPQFKHF